MAGAATSPSAGIVIDHRNGEALGELRQAPRPRADRRPTMVMISGCSAFAIHSASVAIACGSGCGGAGSWRGADRQRLGDRRRQRLARQHQIDRPARRWSSSSHRRAPPRRRSARGFATRSPTSPFRAACRPGRTSPAPSGSGALREPKLPFSVNGVRPAARISGARSRDEVGEVVDGVAGADVDMHHHGLRPAGHQIGAMRHRDREVFVRHQQRLRQFGVAAACAR